METMYLSNLIRLDITNNYNPQNPYILSQLLCIYALIETIMVEISIDKEEIQENGIVKFWLYKNENELDQLWQSIYPIWDFLDGRDIFRLIQLDETIEIKDKTFKEFFLQCD